MMENTWDLLVRLIPMATIDTLYMIFVSALIGLVLGLPIGVILFITGDGQIWERPKLHLFLSIVTNIGRSFPFAILIIAIIPFTRFIVGTSLGTTASIVPLSLAAIPYLARVVEASLQDVEKMLVDAAIVMGSNPIQIVLKVLLPEAIPTLISTFTVAVVNLVGYSTMAGLVGGGGLGTVAIQYGYYRFNGTIMLVTVILLILIVIGIQWLGAECRAKIARKRGLL